MESYVLVGCKAGIIAYQSKVYFDFDKVSELRNKMKQEFDVNHFKPITKNGKQK